MNRKARSQPRAHPCAQSRQIGIAQGLRPFSLIRRAGPCGQCLIAQPDIDAAVAGARAPAITGRREESVVTARRRMRMRGGATDR
jgi:hypothetical protein